MFSSDEHENSCAMFRADKNKLNELKAQIRIKFSCVHNC